ncbi:MAG: bis(5'-nucleosyl)-tetraphosphatase (symmetrical) YqeK [Lachnospiraceae bacterium]
MNLDKLRKQMNKVQDDDRFEHTLGVAYTAANLAAIYGEDVEDAIVAGMLHDCAKCIPDEKKIDLCKKYGLELSHGECKNPSLVHARLGAELAYDKYDVDNERILDAIRYHTMGRPAMTLLEQLIFVADYMEPGRRKAPNLLEIRRLAYQNIDKATVKILEDTLSHLEEDGEEIDYCTVDTLQFYRTKLIYK